MPFMNPFLSKSMHVQEYISNNIQGGFYNWSALKMTKYKEKLEYLNWSANCSSQKVLSVKPQ